MVFAGHARKRPPFDLIVMKVIMTIRIKQGETCYLSKSVSLKEIPSFYKSIIYPITELGDGDVGFFSMFINLSAFSSLVLKKNSYIYIVTTPLIKIIRSLGLRPEKQTWQSLKRSTARSTDVF